MELPNYADRHVEFVSGHNGTSVAEVFWLGGLGPISILLRNLAIPWLFPAKNFATGRICDSILKLLLDFTFIMVPTVLSVSYLSDRFPYVLLCQGLLAVALFAFSMCEYLYLYRDKPKLNDVFLERCENKRPYFITYLRSYVLICTSIAILAVDFPVFPRRFAKTETYGYSLMDTGVGAFVVVNAITAPELRTHPARLTRRILSTLPLVFLGVVRLLTVRLSGYHQHISEYGVHWNFFFTIAAVKMLTSLLSQVVCVRQCAGLLSLLIALVYEYCLQQLNLDRVMLHGVGGIDQRLDLFDANREGIISVAGYAALYLAGIQIGVFLQRPRTRLKTWGLLLMQVTTLCLLSYALLLFSQTFLGDASRRMANFTYCVWILFTILTPMALFLAIEVLALFGNAMQLPLFSVGDTPFEQLEPCLVSKINHRGLIFFLISNLVTGAINWVMPTIDLDNDVSTAVLLLYALALSVIISVF